MLIPYLVSKNNKSFLKWSVIGTGTFFIDYCLFLTFYAIVESVLISNLFSGLISISFNYFSHRSWSFQSNLAHSKSSMRYFINLLFFWTVGTLCLQIFISSGIDPKYAKIIPIPFIAPLSFLSLKFFVFPKDKDK